MKKFCNKCGQKLDEKTGLCPNCSGSLSRKELKAVKKENKKAKKAEKWRSLSIGQKIKKICLRILAVILILLLLAGGTVSTLVYFDVIDIPVVAATFDLFGIKKSEITEEKAPDENKTADSDQKEEDADLSIPYSVEHPDADEYYEKNADILSTEKASEANTLLTESEAIMYLAERGFGSYSVTTTYSASGEYVEETKISGTSSEKHPMYGTIYVSSNGEIWNITIVNNIITAFPMNYNYGQNLVIQVMLSETEYITSYDSEKDKFYKINPHDDVLILKTVPRIDADTLENLTFGDIDAL